MGVDLTDDELEFVRSQPVGRLATAAPDGEPDVAAVLCIYRRSLGLFVIGGLDMARTRKYHNARRNPRGSLVFDTLSWTPYEPKGIKFTGAVEIRTADDEVNLGTLDVPLLLVRPERKWSWGIEEPAISSEGRFALRVDDGELRAL